MPPLPTIIFIHGAWHKPVCFKKVIDILHKHDYDCVTVDLPSAGGAAADIKDLEPDKEVIRTTVTKVAEQGKDVIVVAHSYGGIPTSCALEGMGKTDREKAGQKGGVIKLCYITAFLLGVGPSLVATVGMAPFIRPEPELLYVDDPISAFYNDLPAEEAEHWKSQLQPHQVRSTFFAPVTYAAWKDIPAHYLLAKQDNALPLMYQEQMCEQIKQAGGTVEMETLDASHSPFLSQPDYVAGWIRRAAGEESVDKA